MRPVIGIDVGGTSIRAVSSRGDTGRPVRVGTPRDLGDLLPRIGELIDSIGAGGFEAIGVGCAGLVDHATGTLRWMPHAEGGDVPIGDGLRRAFDVPVWVDNDANAAALGESVLGAGQGARMVLVVTVGTGIGAGLVIDGEVERGRGHLGEVGHMRLADGPVCRCGRSGCWETLASGRALDAAAAAIEPGATGGSLGDLAARGSVAAEQALDGAGRWLGVGLGNLILAFDPDVVILGGSVGVEGDLLSRARRHLEEDPGGLAVSGLPPIVAAGLGAAAGLEGAMIGATEVMP